jgi:hypothetical protein
MNNTTKPAYGNLCDAKSNDIIRPATRLEAIMSACMAGDEGGIEVDGRIVYCDIVLTKYAFATDGESGKIEAVDWPHAKAILTAMLPSHRVAYGGWGWVENTAGDSERFEIGDRD